MNKYFPDNFDSLSIDEKYKVVKKLLLENKIKINEQILQKKPKKGKLWI